VRRLFNIIFVLKCLWRFLKITKLLKDDYNKNEFSSFCLDFFFKSKFCKFFLAQSEEDNPYKQVRNSPSPPPTIEELPWLEKHGESLEHKITVFFTWWGPKAHLYYQVFILYSYNTCFRWGRICSKYPAPIIFLSLGFAAGLCSGIVFLEVTTDPIELWAAPESRCEHFLLLHLLKLRY